MNIHFDNSPNRHEYVLAPLCFLSLFAPSLTLPYSMGLLISVLLVFIVVPVFLLYNKKINVRLTQETMRIDFKIGFVVYRRLERSFNNVKADEKEIRFYNGGTIVLKLDVDPAIEEDEATTLSLWSGIKSFDLGNKKNCHQIFDEIKRFYVGGKH